MTTTERSYIVTGRGGQYRVAATGTDGLDAIRKVVGIAERPTCGMVTGELECGRDVEIVHAMGTQYDGQIMWDSIDRNLRTYRSAKSLFASPAA